MPHRHWKILRGIKPMGLSYPYAESLGIISFQTVKIFPGVKPMGLSAPRAYSIDIIAVQTIKLWGINLIILSDHGEDS